MYVHQRIVGQIDLKFIEDKRKELV